MTHPPRLEVVGLAGLPDVRPGDDLAELLVAPLRAAGVREGDVVVVTSKVVAKAEGRVRRGVDRDFVIDEEARDVVAEWWGPAGRTVVARTRHGFVLAAAGVDASNTEPGTLVLLPEDPDASARALRRALLLRLGLHRLGVLLTDTMGRAWREGLVDLAVGCAGLAALDDLRGTTDAYGHRLGATVVAVADEVAAASELVRPKAAGVPAALVRGLDAYVGEGDGPGAAALVRAAASDRFGLGAREAVRAALRAYGSGRPAVPPAPDAAEQAAAAVRAALPGVVVEVVGDLVRVVGSDARAAEARVLLRVALAGEGLPPYR